MPPNGRYSVSGLSRVIGEQSVSFPLFLLLLFAVACSSSGESTGNAGVADYPHVKILESTQGIASYYHNKFHGRKTANGEIYDKNELTAAHPTYPFGTYVRVTAIESGKTVVVRINDRGPHVGSRIIDLSRRAARDIEMLRAGLMKVRVDVLTWGDS